MPRSVVRRSIAAAVVLACVPATAGAVSVRDPNIGWPPALQRELGLRAVPTVQCGLHPTTRRGNLIQYRFAQHPKLDRELPKIFRAGTTNRWGAAWFDVCDGGRFEVGIASGGDPADARRKVRQARRLFRAEHFSSYRLVAVRSTYRALSDQTLALSSIDDLADAGLVSYGTDTRRNAIVIEYAARAITPQQLSRLVAIRTQAPVSIVLQPAKTNSLEGTDD